VYPISFASSVFGAPSEIHTVGELGATGVDTSAHLALRTADGRTAHLSTAIDSVLPIRAGISGTEGRIDFEPGFFAPTTVTVRRGQFQDAELGTFTDGTFAVPHHGLSYQATALASYAAEGRTESPLHPHHEVVSVMATIDSARAAIAASAS
jgi:predicted dehydrogenase